VTKTNELVTEASATPHDVEPKMRKVFYTALVVFALNSRRELEYVGQSGSQPAGRLLQDDAKLQM
jgi:hypothetical protein